MKKITPHAAREKRKLIAFYYAEARAHLREARRLRATGRILDREDAEGLITMAWHERQQARKFRAELAECVVEKGARVSPTARARLIASGRWTDDPKKG